MRVQSLSRTVLCSLAFAALCPTAQAMTRDEIVAKLESAGYSQIRQAPSGKIKSFKAIKDGKEVSVIIDSTGHIQELQ